MRYNYKIQWPGNKIACNNADKIWKEFCKKHPENNKKNKLIIRTKNV